MFRDLNSAVRNMSLLGIRDSGRFWNVLLEYELSSVCSVTLSRGFSRCSDKQDDHHTLSR